MNEFAKAMGDLFTNPVVLCAALSWFLAQVIKLITSPKYRKGMDFLRFAFGSGGMPSSHSAVVMGACISCGILEGFDSTVFALSGVLALVVMRDALGIRREAGKHASVLNDITQEMAKENEKFSEITLAEFLGHTRLQVIAGAMFGCLVACVCQLWFFPAVGLV